MVSEQDLAKHIDNRVLELIEEYPPCKIAVEKAGEIQKLLHLENGGIFYRNQEEDGEISANIQATVSGGSLMIKIDKTGKVTKILVIPNTIKKGTQS